MPADVAPQWWSVRQVGDGLGKARGEFDLALCSPRTGSPVAWLVTTDSHLFARWSESTHQQQLILKDGLKIPLNGRQVEPAKQPLGTHHRALANANPGPPLPDATATDCGRMQKWKEWRYDSAGFRQGDS